MTAQTVLAATSTGEAITFWVLAPLAVIAAIMMVLSKSAVHAALFLAAVMLSLAGLYAAQDAPFLAAVQVIVYTGAILMLFLFVLMLVGVDSSDSLVETLRGQRVAALVVGLGFAALLMGTIASAVVQADGTVASVGLEEANEEGNVVGIARLLFTDYLFAFEVTSALLITAALGAMVLAHKERTTPRATQRELAKARFAGGDPFALPGPGVFAGRNSTATPALLPDGSEAKDSVSAVLTTQSYEAPSDGPSAVRGATGHGATGHGATGHSATGHSASGHGATGHSASGHSATGHGASGNSATGHSATGHSATSHSATVQDAVDDSFDGEKGEHR